MKCILNICQKNPTWCILYSPQTPRNASPKHISWSSPVKVTLGARRRHTPATQVYPHLPVLHTCLDSRKVSPAVTDHQVNQMKEKPSVGSNCLLVSVPLLSPVSTLPKTLSQDSGVSVNRKG